MVDQREEIVSFVRMSGPVLPVQIAKKLETDVMIASAMLSELVSTKNMRLTRLAIGGSPLYYLPGQESLLGNKLYHVMNSMEKEAYNLIKEKEVVAENELTPAVRVALKGLKDFAFALYVREGDKEYAFWRFYLVGDERAQEIIRKKIGSVEPLKEEKVEPVKEEVKPEPVKEVPKVEVKVGEKVEEKIVEKRPEITADALENLKRELISELRVKVDTPNLKKEIVKKVELDSKFYLKISNFCESYKLKVIEALPVKKGKEYDLVVEVPSNMGLLRYYMKAKEKASISDTDLALAYGDGELRKLPVLFLSNGNLTKKAEAYMAKLKGYLVFKKL